MLISGTLHQITNRTHQMILSFPTVYTLVAGKVFVNPYPALTRMIDSYHEWAHQKCAELLGKSFEAH